MKCNKYKSKDMNDIKNKRLQKALTSVYKAINKKHVSVLFKELEDTLIYLQQNKVIPEEQSISIYMKGYAEGMIDRFNVKEVGE